MENVFLTSLTTPEVRQMLRQELEQFFESRKGFSGASEPEEEILNIEQAASFLNLTVPTLYTLTSKREIPSCKRGKRLYFSKEELTKWIKQGRNKTLAEIEAEAGSHIKRKGGKL